MIQSNDCQVARCDGRWGDNDWSRVLWNFQLLFGGCGIQPQCCCKLHPTSLESGTRLINFIFLRGGMALSSGSRPEFMKLNYLMKCGTDYVAQADFEPLHSSDSLVPSSEVLGLQVCVTESSLVEITLNDN